MELLRSDSFRRDFKQLSAEIQDRAKKQFGLLLENPFNPSLRTKKMEGKWGKMGVYEARVTRGYRFTFKIKGDTYLLRRIGPHDILRHP
jgi:mRNA-degrading endonuclease YafQ of YafQ-DinJ toxin-antitoxin module